MSVSDDTRLVFIVTSLFLCGCWSATQEVATERRCEAIVLPMLDTGTVIRRHVCEEQEDDVNYGYSLCGQHTSSRSALRAWKALLVDRGYEVDIPLRALGSVDYPIVALRFRRNGVFGDLVSREDTAHCRDLAVRLQKVSPLTRPKPWKHPFALEPYLAVERDLAARLGDVGRASPVFGYSDLYPPDYP